MSDQTVPAEEVVPVEDEAERNDIHEFDFGRVMLLLSVMEKQVNVAPKATSIFGIAQAELNEMNDAARDIARARNDRIKEAEAKRQKLEQDRINAEREEHESAVRPREVPARELQADPNSPATVAPEMTPGQPMPNRRVDAPNRRV